MQHALVMFLYSSLQRKCPRGRIAMRGRIPGEEASSARSVCQLTWQRSSGKQPYHASLEAASRVLRLKLQQAAHSLLCSRCDEVSWQLLQGLVFTVRRSQENKLAPHHLQLLHRWQLRTTAAAASHCTFAAAVGMHELAL